VVGEEECENYDDAIQSVVVDATVVDEEEDNENEVEDDLETSNDKADTTNIGNSNTTVDTSTESKETGDSTTMNKDTSQSLDSESGPAEGSNKRKGDSNQNINSTHGSNKHPRTGMSETASGTEDEGATVGGNAIGKIASENACGGVSGTASGNGNTSANASAHDQTNLDHAEQARKLLNSGIINDYVLANLPPLPDTNTSGASATIDDQDKKLPPMTPKNQRIPTLDPFTDPTPRQGKAILHIRGTNEIELDLTQQYATIAKDCVMRDIKYSGENDTANIVEAKRGDVLCLKTFETFSGIVHASTGRLDKSAARYYKLETKILVSIFKSQKNVAMKNIFIARPSGQDIIEANPDIHPLTRERTETIFHCLVTNMSPTEEDYEYLDGEPHGPGHDVNFMHYYNNCLKVKPSGVLKRWEYRYSLGLSDFNHKKNPGIVFQKRIGVGFDTQYKFVYNKDLKGKPEARMYYIEEFKKNTPSKCSKQQMIPTKEFQNSEKTT
jgi:hypothetical protein